MSTTTSIAVVTLSDDARLPHVRNQVAALRRWAPGVRHYRADLGTERNLARARNAAADAAVAEGADLLIFLDADCIPGPDLVQGYRRAVDKHPAGLHCGPVTYLPEAALDPADPLTGLGALTDPHPARPDPPPGVLQEAVGEEYNLFWSLSFALHAGSWRDGPRFDEGYRGYGGEDTDFAWLQRQSGRRMFWVGGAHAYHQWHPVSSPPVEHLDDILVNAARFHARWGSWPMLGWLREFEAMGLAVFDGDTWRRGPGRAP